MQFVPIRWTVYYDLFPEETVEVYRISLMQEQAVPSVYF